MPRASACGSSWLSVESRRVALGWPLLLRRAELTRRGAGQSQPRTTTLSEPVLAAGATRLAVVDTAGFGLGDKALTAF
ncbi:hypothetical protein EMIHUDRAFT_231279 [Emiliania huxleyi CCMP1516]|uniref:G domain-containing protein n=2 Tax=Emiliania huxleyi TaxID=2903 RepID=A0A0D3K7X0_EMIH1|nr:hypothetical protein EMIHUDRAFT_231279 [Emiliania huxleyi CCMP1516]EOD31855.1 hypothetical protein EMIHUDRAFT_231279 [Emiliania huxleyi CCMP1516]|eukprot:XP_005784284.1 hypothetical protein EMIHUDRAFT_231279 [Emiliania huxleyi CCMP1516]